MDGSLTYGPMGRLLSIVAGIAAFIGALEASGVFGLLPQKYKWIGLLLTAMGVGVTVFSERAQGGASNPQVRAAAEESDLNNAAEEAEEEIELDEINR